MIIVKITGGLGNQLFQYSLGRALSLKLNCELVLDTSFYPTQTLRKYELDKFNIQARLATQKEIDSAGAGNGFFSRLIRKIGLISIFYPNYVQELESIKYVSKVDNCKVGSYLDGYWQNPSYFNKYKHILKEDLTPKSSLSREVYYWLELINKLNSVSVHVRRGDYINNPYTNNTHGTCSLDYYNKAINLIKLNVKNPVFFVFSDDILWCKEHFSGYDNFHFVDNTKMAIDDLYLMYNCNHNVIANSTFSWWGTWLKSAGMTVAPKNWFVDENRCNNSLFPDDWFKI